MEEREWIHVDLKLPASALDSLSRLAEQLQRLAAAASAGPERSAAQADERGVNGGFDPARFMGLASEGGPPEPPAAEGAEGDIAGAVPVREEISGGGPQPGSAGGPVELPVEDPAPAGASPGEAEAPVGASGPEFQSVEDAQTPWSGSPERDGEAPAAPAGSWADVDEARSAGGEADGDTPDAESARAAVKAPADAPDADTAGADAVLRDPASAWREVGAGPETPVSRWESFGFGGGAEAEAPVTAESISRAFQRDGRRYDGGFPLY